MVFLGLLIGGIITAAQSAVAAYDHDYYCDAINDYDYSGDSHKSTICDNLKALKWFVLATTVSINELRNYYVNVYNVGDLCSVYYRGHNGVCLGHCLPICEVQLPSSCTKSC